MKTPNYYKGKVYGYEAHEVIEDFAGDNNIKEAEQKELLNKYSNATISN